MGNTKKTSSAFRLFENRRQYPRLRLSNLPVKVTGAGGNSLKATIHDISPDGAQIRYMISDGLNLFVDEKAQVQDIKTIKFIIEFTLAYKGEKINVKLQARPVYIRTVSQRVMAAGILFMDSDLTELKKVSDYLFYQLEMSYTNSGNWDIGGFKAEKKNKPENVQPAPREDTHNVKNTPSQEKNETTPEPERAAQETRDTTPEPGRAAQETKETTPEPERAAQETKKISPEQPANIDPGLLHAEIRRLASSQKILLETIRRLDDRILKIEQTLFKKPE